MSRHHVVDSSGWLEYFSDGSNADEFAYPLSRLRGLIVPVISVYEVFKRVLQQCDESAALQAAALMQQGQIIEITTSLAMQAASLSVQHKLPMADSLILATARQFDATLWTQDQDFEGLDKVRYIAKSAR